jgi:small-conductance mechanosensitive channel
MPDLDLPDLGLPRWMERMLEGTLVVALAILVALVVHSIAFRIARRAARRTPGSLDDILVDRIFAPARWIILVIALSFARRSLPLTAKADAVWQQAAGFLLPALIGWCGVTALQALRDIVEARADISVEDNLRARRKRTRVALLVRIGSFLVLFLTLCMMLLSLPGVRNVGVTLMASAGIAGLVVGAAAQPALKNIIAGVQMAFTEPIRLDDVVIIAGEWGRIEDIRLTYVVVKLWDERRLVVPVSKFLEEPFQNWTRETSQIMGQAMIYVDPRADVARLRDHLKLVVEGNPRWDRRFYNLQVTDIRADAMELRVLATSSDAARNFDLRCDIREAMMAFITREMPEALPRRRLIRGEAQAGAAPA